MGARPAGARQRRDATCWSASACAATPGCTMRTRASSARRSTCCSTIARWRRRSASNGRALLRAPLQLAGDRAHVSRHVRRASTARRPRTAWSRCRAGSRGGRRTAPPAADVVNALPRVRSSLRRPVRPATPRAAAIGEPVKFAFITPRYGADIGAGAEHACRLLAEQVCAAPRRGRADDLRARSPHVEERVLRRRGPRQRRAGPPLRRQPGAGPHRLRHAVAAPADGSAIARRGTRVGAPATARGRRA